MAVKTSNAYGKISISDEAIAKVAAHTSIECYGIVEMVSRKLSDSLKDLFKKDNGAKVLKSFRAVTEFISTCTWL